MFKQIYRVCAALPLITVSISTLASENELLRCPSGTHWVRQHHSRAYTRSDGNVVSASEVEAHCQNNPKGFDLWNKRIKSGTPTEWPNKAERAKQWTVEEQERTLEAFSELPEALWGKDLNGIFRMKSSKNPGNRASGNAGRIVLYDHAFEAGPSLAQILAHELAHHAYDDLPQIDRDSYQFATNWIQTNRSSPGEKASFVRRKCCFVESDGDMSPEEDFANNVEYFLYHPKTLQQLTPNAYNWIKQHFGDSLNLGGRSNAN